MKTVTFWCILFWAVLFATMWYAPLAKSDVLKDKYFSGSLQSVKLQTLYTPEGKNFLWPAS